ncbi:PIN domain protein [Leptospira weilii serovar Ranarum str. ICFT]|uniref:PIN domain protein n=1 Tax=Leptospira weilii serovar Ranarum str. ICFT TaxID=1218598 RepID=N1WLA9_9LEPT|nr:type II toxin-antitoxin system VapC family toxin [Leptospira weilii]EMY77934.1 PIN domain protein [Leptospira weilii serovar Ranarum str. ICFT]
MTFLLDTHVLLWSLFEPKNLSSKIKTAISNRSNRIFVSNISLWEISLKFAIGKLELNQIKPEELPEKIIESGFEFLEDKPEVFASFCRLQIGKHADPFDRFIIWQSISNRLTLITKDKHFKKYESSGLKILW